MSFQIDFRHEGAECDNVVKMAFDKKGADARKQWIKDFEPGTFLDMNVDSISYQEFVNKELILFSIARLVAFLFEHLYGLGYTFILS